MTEHASFELDRVRAWMAKPIGGKAPADSPAFQRMADVVLEAMIAAGGDNPDVQLAVLTKVQAMIVAGMTRHASAAEVKAILERVGPVVQDEAIAFLRAMRRDLKGRN